MLSKKQSGPGVKARRETEIEFVGEQDGVAERDLKQALGSVLEKHRVQRAYLARVRTGTADKVTVTLCLAAARSRQLVNEVAGVFHQRFGSNEHLDILFLSGPQESKVAGVCPAFFVAT
jgi:hypothetical protein